MKSLPSQSNEAREKMGLPPLPTDIATAAESCEAVDANRPERWWNWGNIYLSAVVLAHVLMIALAVGEGSIVLIALWYYLAIPLFLPGLLIAAYALAASSWNRKVHRYLPLSMLVVALCVVEWVLLFQLPSGMARF